MVVKDRCAEQDPTAPVAVKEAMTLQSTGSGKEKVPDTLVTEQVTSWWSAKWRWSKMKWSPDDMNPKHILPLVIKTKALLNIADQIFEDDKFVFLTWNIHQRFRKVAFFPCIHGWEWQMDKRGDAASHKNLMLTGTLVLSLLGYCNVQVSRST